MQRNDATARDGGDWKRELDRIFKPERIALYGAHENPTGVGSTVLRNLISGGFAGVVYPVHPKLEAVQGIQAHPDAASLPRVPDLAVIASPAFQVPGIVRECGEAGIRGMVVISAGFREAGPDGARLERELGEEGARFEGMRILGPNCLGFLAPKLRLNASFALGMPKAGHVAFLSQSGALCTSVLDWALEQGIGFSHFISMGNMLDLDFGDLIDYVGEDDETRSVILYVESLADARKFMVASRAFARTKPIVAYKGGRFAESAKAATSHTGAMAGEDAVYEAAFQRAGIARVFEIGDIFNCAELVARYRPPRGPRLAIVTNAGGPGVMATDTLVAHGGVLAKLADETMEKLDGKLPPSWSHGNPVDVLGDARPKRFAKATEIVLADANVDAALVILTPQAMTKPTVTARSIADLASKARKPMLAVWLGGGSMREGIAILNEAGIATYATPEAAVRAFMTLVDYARNLETLYEVPRDIPVSFTLDRKKLRRNFEALVPEKGEILTEADSKKLLRAYGIPVTEPRPAATAEEAVETARGIGYPVVLKIDSPDITHKSDVGGVELDLHDDAAVWTAFARIENQAKRREPDARIRGVTVQRMVRSRHGIEMILGMRKDPTFGSTILVGTGGTMAEILRDRALGFPPLNERLARRMLESLRSWPLLRGYRGRPAVDLDRLIELLMRLSYLVADYPEIRELDVNPLLVSPDDAVALDARVILDRELLGEEIKPYSHLALHPYPEQYVRPAALRGGTPVLLRPIQPEDEPRWMAMLGSCSRDTIYTRFRGHVRWQTHEIARRYCYIDYDREIAIVAEVDQGDERKLVGVGRLVADPDLETAEFAVLVTDAWQGRGLGTLLTDYCTEIARGWGVRKIVAETSSDNTRMVKIFRRGGFAVEVDPGSDTVEVEMPLRG